MENALYFSPTTLLIMQQIIISKKAYTHQLAKVLSISAPHVNRICSRLESEKVLISARENNKKWFELNYHCALTRELLRMSTIIKINTSKHFQTLASKFPFGIYGSFAQGRQQKESDMDMWVFASRSHEKSIRLILNHIEEEWGHPVNVVYLDKHKLKKMRQEDPEFFLRLRLQSISDEEEIFE